MGRAQDKDDIPHKQEYCAKALSQVDDGDVWPEDEDVQATLLNDVFARLPAAIRCASLDKRHGFWVHK